MNEKRGKVISKFQRTLKSNIKSISLLKYNSQSVVSSVASAIIFTIIKKKQAKATKYKIKFGVLYLKKKKKKSTLLVQDRRERDLLMRGANRARAAREAENPVPNVYLPRRTTSRWERSFAQKVRSYYFLRFYSFSFLLHPTCPGVEPDRRYQVLSFPAADRQLRAWTLRYAWNS